MYLVSAVLTGKTVIGGCDHHKLKVKININKACAMIMITGIHYGYYAEVKLVRDCGQVFQNNSIHDANDLFRSPNGLRCYSAMNNTPVAEWIFPNGQIIINNDHTLSASIYINRMNSSGFIELIRNTQLTQYNHMSGVYTCKISSCNGIRILHVGVYSK